MRSSAKGLISVPKRTWIPIFNHRGTAHRHVKNHAKKMGGKKKNKKTTKKAILCYTVRQANKMLGGLKRKEEKEKKLVGKNAEGVS